jgi:hypothetical protein
VGLRRVGVGEKARKEHGKDGLDAKKATTYNAKVHLDQHSCPHHTGIP